MTVELAEPGPIGLVTDEHSAGLPGVWVAGIKAGGQAARHPEIEPGMRIVGVAGKSCAELGYRDVTNLIRHHSQRPLALTLQPADAEAAAAVPPEGVPPPCAEAIPPPGAAAGPAPGPGAWVDVDGEGAA